jgi:predicted small lipoprotein YifL
MANRIKRKAIGLSLLVVFMLTACGQKRALYLPEEPAKNNTSQDSQVASESAKEGKN